MKQTPKERFDSKYIKNLETGCWEWNAYISAIRLRKSWKHVE